MPAKVAAGYLNRQAAGQKNQGIQPRNAREIERHPIIRQTFAHEKGTRQRHKKHDDPGHGELNDREVSALRHTSRFTPRTVAVILAASGNVCASAATGFNYLELIRD